MSQKNESLLTLIDRYAEGGQLPCALAFKVVEEGAVPPGELGQFLDQQGVRLIKCQLGLFGYEPQKKIVKAQLPGDENVARAIESQKQDDKLSCRSVWEIAAQFKLPKLAVSNACEALGIKIAPCQLGAF